MKKVSIITINLNNQFGFRATAQSVAFQSAFDDIEWIVIDGGSVDGSLNVMDEYRDRMAYCVSEPDSGIYNAMNKGIAQAHGEYVLFLNSGDCLKSPTSIEQFIYSPEYGRFDYCVGIMEKTLNGKVCGVVYPHESITALGLMTKAVSHQAEFIRRSRFTHVQYNETFRIMADFEFTFNDLVYNGATYAPLKYVVSVFDAAGISSHVTPAFKEEVRCCFASVLPNAIYLDYMRWMKGGTLLEKIVRLLPSNSIEAKMLTLFAGVFFLPRWFCVKFKSLVKLIR